ncbi:hypothetical protein [Micromonospora endolithica]|uniref:Uncharacterized protein n=1 Tax=Micromonospora endolithica TaxID=230091 RepID=A0A3A9ZQD5_9ACTN|nr:hypothetical protein [Micromonospora endolithica]RKN50488.1 hypothetical protein D7223_01445 [Micromonospora endolithica]TWJ20822.1 hypothetical protein JD76_00922 [Micromonospora endolithica]
MSTARTAKAPMDRIGAGLERLRHDIDALVDVVTRDPQARPQLVDIHHQVRLLGQHLNTALGAPAEPVPPEEPR